MFIDFIKRPSAQLQSQEKGSNFWKESPVIFLTIMLFLFLLGIVYTIVVIAVNLSLDVDLFPEIYSQNMESFTEKVPFPYLWAIILGPAYEEISFRLGLSFKKKEFIISILLIVFCLSGGNFLYSGEILSYVFNVVPRLIVLTILFFIGNYYISQRQVDYVKSRYSGLIIYLFALIFAVLHLDNYFPFEWGFLPFYMLVTVAIFILAMTYSYLRLKYGIVYAMLFHAFWNSIQFFTYLT